MSDVCTSHPTHGSFREQPEETKISRFYHLGVATPFLEADETKKLRILELSPRESGGHSSSHAEVSGNSSLCGVCCPVVELLVVYPGRAVSSDAGNLSSQGHPGRGGIRSLTFGCIASKPDLPDLLEIL